MSSITHIHNSETLYLGKEPILPVCPRCFQTIDIGVGMDKAHNHIAITLVCPDKECRWNHIYTVVYEEEAKKVPNPPKEIPFIFSCHHYMEMNGPQPQPQTQPQTQTQVQPQPQPQPQTPPTPTPAPTPTPKLDSHITIPSLSKYIFVDAKEALNK